MRCVNGSNARCAALERRHRESARVTKHIQDVPALGILTEQKPVFALVNEITCLLTLDDIHIKFHSVLQNLLLSLVSVEKTVFDSRAVGFGDGLVALVVDGRNLVAEYLAENLRKHLLQQVHTFAMCLKNNDSVVIITDKTRKTVALAVYQPADVGIGAVEITN